MRNRKFYLIGGTIFILLGCKINQKIETYEQLIDSVNILERNNSFQSAKELLAEYSSFQFDNSFPYAKELIYINEKLGDYKANLEIFTNGHSKGQFFLINQRMPKYKPYTDLPGFDEIVVRDNYLRDSTNQFSKPLFEVFTPHNYKPNRLYPVLFIFHGGGSNIVRAKKHWNSEILDQKFMKVFVRSALHYDYDTFGWRNSDKQGLNDLKRIYEELVPYYNLDTNRLYAAGISAGGTFAVMACFNQAIPLKGYLGVCTGFPSELSLESFAKHTRLKAYMVVGENDFNKPRQDSLRELYEKYSINYSYNMIDSMGHQYPDNFDTWLDSGINFLLKDHELD